MNIIEKDFLPFQGMTGTQEYAGGIITASFTKTAYNSLLYFDLSNLDEVVLSDYTYLNIIIESADVSEFLIELSGRDVMKHYVVLEDGTIELTMTLSSLLLASSLDSLQYINITPMPNSNSATGTFTITKAEFSNTPLVEYTTKTTVEITDWQEIGANFTIDNTAKEISWLAISGTKSLFTRMYGDYTNYDTIIFNATVTSDVLIEFDIVGAKYEVQLTPSQTEYQIDLSNPTSGSADIWKFETGFNLYLWITTTSQGSIVINSLTFTDSE